MIRIRGVAFLVICLALLTQGCVSTSNRHEDPEQAANIYADLGLEYLRQGNLELSLIKLKRSLELNEDHKAANHYIAEVYKQMGQKELADEHFKKAVKLDPSNPTLLNNYGAFLCGEGRFDESETYFVKAAESPRYRKPELAYENLGLCAMSTENKDKAEPYFRKALKINPKLPKSLYQLAQLNFDKHDYLHARAFIQRLNEMGYSEPSLQLAIKIERAQGDEAAVEKYTKLLQEKYPDADVEQ